MGLREQAALDARAILEDTSGFAWPVTLTSPAGVETSLKGFTTDVGQTIDPDTGQAVAGRRASVAVPRAALPELPEAVAEKSRKPWIATFADSRGVVGRWKVVEVLPDSAIGLVVLLLEIHQLATVKLSGAILLPQLQLAGSGFELAVTFDGSIPLPQLQIAGSPAPVVTFGATLPLPQLQLAGSFTVDPNIVSAWLRLAGGSTVSGDYDSIPDIFASPANPATQSVAAQRPTAQTSGNGLPIARFIRAEPNQLRWPKASNNNSTQKWGFACWIKVAAYSAQAYLFDFGGATARYDNERINLFFNSSRTIFLEVFGQDTAGYNGRVGSAANAAPLAGNWYFLRVQFDGTQATEAQRIKIFLNEVQLTLSFANNGAGGTPVALRTNAESIFGVIGNFTDNTDGSIALDFSLGPNAFVYSDSPSAAQGAAYMGFEQPT